MNEKIKKIIEDNGFIVNEYDDCISISQGTPLGEDWFEEFGTENFIENFEKFVEDFDYVEQAEIYIDMRGQRGVPNSIKDLLDDAKWKQEQLENVLADIKGEPKINNNKRVAVLVEDFTINCENHTEVLTFNTLDKARETMRERIEEFKKEDLCVDLDKEEKDELSYEKYEDGNWAENHFSLKIYVREIE